jgi:hypothetical protein
MDNAKVNLADSSDSSNEGETVEAEINEGI